ncbi:hypothetical protein [Nocardia brasiliensis]|uniref:hypothetical protein n=1 Tax=Nocardia brasiliensis TaxID=37326 RepID=UPI003D8BB08C
MVVGTGFEPAPSEWRTTSGRRRRSRVAVLTSDLGVLEVLSLIEYLLLTHV